MFEFLILEAAFGNILDIIGFRGKKSPVLYNQVKQKKKN